ncbi:hypothetical protein JL721_2647 [Aureococcus anophagefferens]|nr:hypothetical protein JL721_2647 [Aureococcus anophagefferens]
MGDPVVANDGHSYERAAIATWLATHDTSPRTREPMGGANLVPNHALRAQIGEWRAARGLPAMPERAAVDEPRASPRSSADAAAPGAEEAAARLRARGAVAALRRTTPTLMLDALRPVGDYRVLHELRVDALGGDGLLHAAALNGAARCCAALLGDFRFPLDGPSLRDGALPLHLAAAGASRAVVALLLDRGADANARSRGASPVDAAPPTRLVAAADSTPLHHCALSPLPGRPGIVDALLRAGADPHRRDEHGRWGLAPAHVAAERGKARARARSARARTRPCPSGAAATRPASTSRAPQAPTLRALLDVVGRAPAVVDARTTDGSTPLHLAAAVGSREATEALLDAGADATARTLDGDSPLHVAAWTNALPVAEALLARGAEVDAVKRDGSTPLHLCASRGLYGMVTILLEAGADKRKTTVSGSTPADRAALFRDDRLVRSLS